VQSPCPPGYFCREPALPHVKFAFTNYGVSIGLQAVGAQAARVERLKRYFQTYRSGDEYDTNAIIEDIAAIHSAGADKRQSARCLADTCVIRIRLATMRLMPADATDASIVTKRTIAASWRSCRRSRSVKKARAC
jgi:hypothetical protein